MRNSNGDPFVGTTLAHHYHIERLLGTGGMGSVYLAEDVENGKYVAVKILHPSLSRDDKHVKRFLREVQLTRKVDHPNVVRIFDVGQYKGQLFFTMEQVDGITLKERMTEGLIPVDQISRILAEICAGLEAIHSVGIIHRDLKPGNILLTDDSLKIADFGIARPQGHDLTASQELVGSAGYMSPELWRCEDIDPTSDIYSLGIVLFEMVSGKRPFDGETSKEVMENHLYTPPPTPVSPQFEIPTWMTALNLMMIEKEPMKRPQSASEVLSIIESATHAYGDSRKISSLSPGSDRTRKSRKSKVGAMNGPSLDKWSRAEDMGHASLVPEVYNPAFGLLKGFFASIAILVIILGPSHVLLDRYTALNAVEVVGGFGVGSVYVAIFLFVSMLLAIPSLIFSSITSGFSSQLAAYGKHVCLLLVIGALLTIANLGQLQYVAGSRIANMSAVPVADAMNASLTYLVYGASLLPTVPAFGIKLMSPEARLLPAIAASTPATLVYLAGAGLYLFIIGSMLNLHARSRHDSIKRVNMTMVFLIGLVVMALGNFVAPLLTKLVPVGATDVLTVTTGYLQIKFDTFNILCGGLAWGSLLLVFSFAVLGQYRKALQERARRIQRLEQGLADPGKQLIGRK